MVHSVGNNWWLLYRKKGSGSKVLEKEWKKQRFCYKQLFALTEISGILILFYIKASEAQAFTE